MEDKMKKYIFGFLAVFVVLLGVIFSASLTKQANADENNNVITNVTIKKQNGSDLSSGIHIYEILTVGANINLNKGDVQAGDHSVIQLPKELQFVSGNFDIRDSRDNALIAKVNVDKEKKQLVVAYTEEAANRSEVQASLEFAVWLDYQEVTQPGPLSLSITVNSTVIPLGEVEYRSAIVSHEAQPYVFTKRGWDQTKDGKVRLVYSLDVNQTGQALTNVILKDSLQFTDGKIDESTIKLKTGQWGLHSDVNQYLLDYDSDVADFKAVSTEAEALAQPKTYYLSSDKRSLTVNVGDIAESEGYKVLYEVALDSAPIAGRNYSNKAELLSNEVNNYSSQASIILQLGHGGAVSSAFGLHLVKYNEDKSTRLAGAVFEVTNKDTGSTQELTTDANGEIRLENIVKATYVIKEKFAPEGYELDTQEVTILPTDFEQTATVQKEFINKKVVEKISIKGTKTWDDENNKEGIRPEKITVILNKLVASQKVEVARKEVTAANQWKYEFTELPKTENGEEIKYSIAEIAVAGYETEVKDFDLVNHHVPETPPTTEEPPTTTTVPPTSEESTTTTTTVPPTSEESTTTATTVSPKPEEPTTTTSTTQPELPNTGESADMWMKLAGIIIFVGLGVRFVAVQKAR